MEHLWQQPDNSGHTGDHSPHAGQPSAGPQQAHDSQQECSPLEEQLRMENEHYKQTLRQLVQEEEKLHAANKERIKNGIHCLFFIPMLFFALLFLTKGEKAVFLVLWVLSLFVTAAYMIYIEYMDFQVKERLSRYAGSEDFSHDGLVGTDLEEFEKAVSQLLDQLDEKKSLRRRKMRQILQQGEKPADITRKDTHYE